MIFGASFYLNSNQRYNQILPILILIIKKTYEKNIKPRYTWVNHIIIISFHMDLFKGNILKTAYLMSVMCFDYLFLEF